MLKLVHFVLLLLPILSYSQHIADPLWKSNYDSAQFFWNINKEKSLSLLSKAERIAFNDLGIYHENYLTILNDLGLAYGQVKEFTKAKEYLKQNLSIQKEIYTSDDPRLLHSKCNLAMILTKSGDDLKAKNIFLDVISEWQFTKDDSSFLLATQNLSRLYEVQENLDSALIIIRNALSIPLSNQFVKSLYEIRLAEGRILRKKKKYNEAANLLTTLNEDLDNKPLSVSTLSNSVKIELSLIDIELGLYGKVEMHLLQLYRKLKNIATTDELLLIELTNALASVYERLGVYDKALSYYAESLGQCVPTYGINSLNCILLQNNVAGIYLKQGSIKEAITEYERSISIYKTHLNYVTTDFLTSVNNLGSAYRHDGQYALALRYFHEVYNILEERNLLNEDLAATVLNNMGVTYTLKGEYAKATDYFEKTLKIKQHLYGLESPVLLDVIGNLSIVYWAVHRYDDAIPLFEKSLALATREVKYIFPNLTDTEQVQFYQRQKQNFERFNTLATQLAYERPELLLTMFNNQLLLKSIIFFSTKRRNTLVENSDDNQLNTQAKLVQEKGVQLGHFYQLPLSELQSMGISLKTLENEIDSVEKIILHSLSTIKSIDKNFEWKDVQQSLKPTEALIEIIRFRKYDVLSTQLTTSDKQISIGFTDSVYYAALITSKESNDFPKLVILKNGTSLEKRFLNYYRNALKFDVDDNISYSQFWKPFEEYLSGKQKIYISADGVFNQLNLNSIRDEDGKFILEKYDLHRILNASQLVQMKERRKIDFSKIALLGNPIFDSQKYEPLPGTHEEVFGILNALKLSYASTKVFMRQSANKANLKLINSPDILHIATHGFFSPDLVYLNEEAKNNFLFHSGIILSASSQSVKTQENTFDSDGIVTSYDVLNLNLASTELVVLSACETGLGKIENGEGVYGLQRSFLQAGAREIIISLWKVEDMMTKELMIKFYGYLGQQYTTKEAFKRAQIDMLHAVANPRFWASFVLLSGD
jgi:CHAT domain-containing protein